MAKFGLILLILIAFLPFYVSAAEIPRIPFYSQFADIEWPIWRKNACGVASLAMVINFFNPEAASAQSLLEKGISAGFYLNDAGWTHKGLALLSEQYGMEGETYDLSDLSMTDAFKQLEKILNDGPVIASVYYEFNPKSTIPHLAVINKFDGENLYYNDPAAETGDKKITLTEFKNGWKKKFIVIRPKTI